ncbi:MAG: PepSY domain-containing protein [Chromatiales bacterium]
MVSRILLIAGLLEAPLGLSAGHPPDAGAAAVQVAQAATSPDQAAAVARASTGGRVLGVDWGDSGGQPVYLVRVLMPDGRIKVVPVAARGRR